MRIMIVGAGMVGQHLSERLSQEGHEVVLIDRDRAKLRRIEKELNILTVQGSGASTRTLEEAGIDRADLFIAATDTDEVNLVACIISKQYNVKTRIARVRNEEFFTHGAPLSEQALGIDMLISPDMGMVDEIIKLATRSEAFEVVELAGGEVVLLGYLIHEDNPFVGYELSRMRRLSGVIVAIVRNNTTIIPHGSDKLEKGDKVYILARKKDIPAVEELFHIASRAPKRVFIIGGGTIGVSVARRMEKMGLNVTLVEQDATRCEALTEVLEKTVILNCDGLGINCLLTEGIEAADLVVAVTGSDTTNILASLLAKHHGAKKCMTQILQPDFIPLLGKLNIDVTLQPRLIAANLILRFVRGGGHILSVATLIGSDAEVMEIKVPEGRDDLLDKPIKTLHFPHGAIIGAIIRTGGMVVVPSGDTELHPDDSLIIFFTSQALQQVEEFFQ